MIDSPKRILITGASGAIGPRVVHAFHDKGFIVRTFSLDPPQIGMFPEGVENLVGDITNSGEVSSAMTGIDYVVHMAALLHVDNPPPSLEPMYDRINVDGTSNVVAACTRENVQRIVFFSTIAVYGPGKGKIHSEDTPPNPISRYAMTKLAGEGLVLAAKGRDGHALGTILRLSSVYGPRVKGNFRRLVYALARRRFIAIGNGNNRRTLTYDSDVAAAAVLAATNPKAAGQIYNVTDGQIYTMTEILTVLCDLLGRQAPRVHLSSGVARMAVGAFELGARVVGKKSSFAKATFDKYLEDMPVSGERIMTELGFSPRFDLEHGWSEVIDEMRRAGNI